MKNIIFRSFVVIGILAILIAIISFRSAPTPHNYLYVRIVESENAGMSQLLVSDGSTIIKTVWLEKKWWKPVQVSNNFNKIVSALDEIRNQGYKLISSNGGGGYEYDATTYIYEKE